MENANIMFSIQENVNEVKLQEILSNVDFSILKSKNFHTESFPRKFSFFSAHYGNSWLQFHPCSLERKCIWLFSKTFFFDFIPRKERILEPEATAVSDSKKLIINFVSKKIWLAWEYWKYQPLFCREAKWNLSLKYPINKLFMHRKSHICFQLKLVTVLYLKINVE